MIFSIKWLVSVKCHCGVVNLVNKYPLLFLVNFVLHSFIMVFRRKVKIFYKSMALYFCILWFCVDTIFYAYCVVTCVIMQKNGAGLHTASSCFWNSNTDGELLCPAPNRRGH